MCYFHLNMEGNDKAFSRVKANLTKSLYSPAILNLTRFPHRTNLSQISALCSWAKNLATYPSSTVFVGHIKRIKIFMSWAFCIFLNARVVCKVP